MSDVLNKAAAGLMAVRKSPFRTYVGPGPRPGTAEGALPIADYERRGAEDQIEQIAVMAQPVIERFGEQEAKLVAALTDLVAKLRLLVQQGEVTKAQAPAPHRRRFIRVVDPEVKATIVDSNSLDGMVLDATRRVRKGEEYH